MATDHHVQCRNRGKRSILRAAGRKVQSTLAMLSLQRISVNLVNAITCIERETVQTGQFLGEDRIPSYVAGVNRCQNRNDCFDCYGQLSGRPDPHFAPGSEIPHWLPVNLTGGDDVLGPNRYPPGNPSGTEIQISNPSVSRAVCGAPSHCESVPYT